jgi:hypothetical protein
MKRDGQHLNLENTYIKYRYRELIETNKKLESEVLELSAKLENLYKNHANLTILLQEKGRYIRNIMDKPKNVLSPLIFMEDFAKK